MAINKKLLHFNEYQNFNSKKLSANSDNTQYTLGISDQIYNGEDLDIKYQSIVFIKDTKQIWTHGQLYNSQNIDLSDYLTEEQIRALIPTKLGDLINDVGYITEANIDESIYQEIYNQIVNTADLENYYTRDEVDNIVENITIDSDNIDLSDYYTKDEVDELIDGIPGSDSDLTDYVKHEVFDPFKKATETSISTLQEDKQDKLVSGFNIKTINEISLLGEGNIAISGGSGGVEIIRIDDVTEPTDSNVYSAKRTDKDFTNKDKKENISKSWTFNADTVFDKHIGSKDFIRNVLGSGWFLGYDYYDNEGKGINSHLEVDTLKVRKKAIFDTLEIKHISHVGGELMITPAGGNIESIDEDTTGGFKCYLKTKDAEGNEIENQFAKDDLVMCKVFDIIETTESGDTKVSTRYYWRKCLESGKDSDGRSYIILSDTEKDIAASDIPAAGDVIVSVGNTTDVTRQNAIVLSSYASGAPSIVLYKGINTFELTYEKAPVIISPELNKFSGDIYMENKDDFTHSLITVLESLISLEVNSVLCEEILGMDAVIGSGSISSDGKSITFDLNPDIYKTWKKNGTIANILRYTQEIVDNKDNINSSITIKCATGFEGYFKDIIIESNSIDKKISRVCQLTKSIDVDDFKITISNEEGYLPYALEVRGKFIDELRDRTGIDIEEGTITLQADNTIIKSGDGEKTIANFTEGLIQLNTYESVHSEVNGREAVKRISADGKEIILDSDVVGSWEKDDIIQVDIKLAEMPINNTISLEWNVGGAIDSNPSDKELTSLYLGPLQFTCEKSVRGLTSPSLKVNYGKVEVATIKRILKYDLKRTGIDIDKGQIILQADGTRINTSEGDTLAEFTEKAIRLNTYEGVYEDENGVDAVSEYSFDKDRNICTITLNDEVVQTWQKEDVIEVNLKLKEIPEDNEIKLTWYNVDSKFNKEEITLTGVDRIYPGPKYFTCSTSTTNFFNSALLVTGSDVEIATVKRIMKYDLKQTGIDIEKGTITLSADTTLIKDGDDKLSLAQFTKNNINFSVYDSIHEDLYGENVVASITNIEGGKSITLDYDKIKDWEEGDLLNIYLYYNNFEISDKELEINPGNSQDKLFTGINILANQLDKVVSKTVSLLRIPKNGDTIILKGGYLPDEIKVRSVLKQDLRRTGIDITNGLIVLQADETRINTSDGETLANFTDNRISFGLKGVNERLGKIDQTLIEIQDGQITLDSDNTKVIDTEYGYPVTLAEFTRDQINLNVYEPYGDVFGENAVVGYEKPTEGTRVSVNLDSNVIKNWKADDIISIKLKYNEFTADERKDISIQGPTWMFEKFEVPQKEIYSETIKTFTINSIPEIVPDTIVTIESDNLPDEVQVRKVFPDGLKRTGIDIESGEITLDADKTTIKDTDLTLAQFTKDQASISVYESTKETLGDNAISGIVSTQNNQVVYNIDNGITTKWTNSPNLKLIIKFTQSAKNFISSLTINSSSNAFAGIKLNNEDINKSIFRDVLWEGNPGQASQLLLQAEFKSGSTPPALPLLVETVELRQTIKSGLKRTGIDIESGLITLDADKTLIKDSDQTIAEFTSDRISLNVFGKNLIQNIPIHEASNRNSLYYADYNVYAIDYAKTIKVGDVLQYSFVIIPKENVSEVTLSGNNAFIQMFGTTAISKTLTKNKRYTISGTIQCKKSYSNALSAVGASGMYATIYTSVNNSQGELYIGQVQGLKRTGIDIESGQITLDSERTLIKSGDKDIALFSTDEYGRSFIRTELIDATNISANQLETKGTINEDNAKINYINIADNSMQVYDDSGSIKTLIHSGALASIRNELIAVHCDVQTLVLGSSDQSTKAKLAGSISPTSELNICYCHELNINIFASNITQEAATISNIILKPYLYITNDNGDEEVLYNFAPYTISSGDFINNNYSSTIKIHGSAPLQKDVQYNIALLVEKHTLSRYQYSISINSGSQFVVSPIYPTTEIASNGYNFNFSGNGYQNANQSGFITAYGQYGLKIDNGGIFITNNVRAASPNWIDLFKILNIN